MNNTQALEVKNLSKYYAKYQALKSVSFCVAQNEIFALIGPNGAGKSTALKIIATLLSPGNGQVLVYGRDIIKDAVEIRKLIGYLPEEAGAYKNLKAIEYLQFIASLFESDHNKCSEMIKLAKEICGLGDKLNNKIGSYSKGMTRKLLLARTLMTHPKLAILDEPTSGLDVINALEIRKIIKDFSKQGMAVLLSSHNMLEIEFLSDRVGLLNKGTVHEIGTPAELKKKYQTTNLEEVFVKAIL